MAPVKFDHRRNDFGAMLQEYRQRYPVVGHIGLAVLVLYTLYSFVAVVFFPPGPFTLTSPAWKHGEIIPTKYTGLGDDVSPPLEWKGVPKGTKSLALIMDDPDAPDPKSPLMIWVHWVAFNIPPTLDGLPEGVTPENKPKRMKQALNDWKKAQYMGPNPPIGRHEYYLELYALDAEMTTIGEKSKKTELKQAMEGHILAQTHLMGTYDKADAEKQ